MLFFDIDNPSPDEIKVWMKKNDFTIDSGSFALGISKRCLLYTSDAADE